MVDGESQLPQTVLRPPHPRCGMCASPPNEISKVGEQFSVSPLGRAQLERSEKITEQHLAVQDRR